MQKSRFGVIVAVKNLDACRAFYQKIIGLNAPVLNSSFWVEFQIDGQGALILEKSDSGADANTPQKVYWKVLSKDIGLLKERLLEYGYEVPLGVKEFGGEELYSCRDPEGNLFFIEAESDC